MSHIIDEESSLCHRVSIGREGFSHSRFVGQLNDEDSLDIPAATGDGLLIVHGRNRALSYEENNDEALAHSRVEYAAFPFRIKSLVAGSLFFRQGQEILLLSKVIL